MIKMDKQNIIFIDGIPHIYCNVLFFNKNSTPKERMEQIQESRKSALDHFFDKINDLWNKLIDPEGFLDDYIK